MAFVQVQLVNAPRVLLAIAAAGNKHARFAQATAMRAAARSTRSQTAKQVAAGAGLPQKLLRNRVRFFLQRDKLGLSSATVWFGVKRKIRSSEHRRAAKAIEARYPKGFAPQSKNRPHLARLWFERRNPSKRVGDDARQRPRERGALPIDVRELDLSGPARRILRKVARDTMRTIYVQTLKRDFLRRIRKAAARR